MVDVTPLIKSGQHVIESYDENGFGIKGERYRKAILLAPDCILPLPDDVIEPEDLNAALFQDLFGDMKYDLILIGAGFDRPPRISVSLHDMILKHTIGMDIMPTGAACRTYNVLLAEERHFVSLLFL